MMDRRTFNRLIGWSPAAIAAGPTGTDWMRGKELVKPPGLKEGSRVGLIAPASPFSPEQLARAVRNLQDLGLEVVLGKHLLDEQGYLAGSDEKRLHDLHEMFRRDDIHAVWCIRGGYGTMRLLPDIDYELIRSHPKILVGYSDITALLSAFYHKAGLITFHGPVGSSTFTEYATRYVKQLLFEGKLLSLTPPGAETTEGKHEVYTIRKGAAGGSLVGGNLSLLAALCGTDYLPSFEGKIVCIEEVGEKPYRIDRMLTQLIQAAGLSKAKGIALGCFRDCSPDPGDVSLSLRETLELCLAPLGCPVSYGWNFGHFDDQFTFPHGLMARMNTEKQTIRLLESPLG